MEKNKWFQKSVVYQIYPRSFMDSNGDGIGDLNGITTRLDYLAELGVDVIWLSPIYKSPNDDNGYDISDYQNIMNEFGSMEDFDKLLDAAHSRGLKIVMDLVVNHTSDEHAWFVESKSSKNNPKRDWYIWRDAPKDGGVPTEAISCFSGTVWEWDEVTKQYYLHIFSKKQPDLNWDNPEVRKTVFDLMDWWCAKGIDGFRMDVISMISKAPEYYLPLSEGGCYNPTNGPHVHEYIQEMNREVLSRYDLMTVGETPGVTVEEAKKYAGADGKELNMVFQFELTDLDCNETGKWNTNRAHLTDIKRVLSKWQHGLYGTAWNSLFWDNHDQPRCVSRFGNDSTPQLREASAKMLAVCLHMLQGTPYIYQGEELGMTNYPFTALSECRDIEALNAYREYVEEKKCFTHDEMIKNIRKASRDNARTPMQWDDTINGGFSVGDPWIPVNPNYTEINASAQVSDPNSVFSFYKALIRLRHEMPIITDGEYTLLDPESEEHFCYTRQNKDTKLIILCNFSDKVIECPYTKEIEGGELVICNYEAPNSEKAPMRAYEARVYKI